MNPRNALRSEDTEQMAVIQWAQYNQNRYPELKWLHHCPNGGSRNSLEAIKLKQMGVKAGVSDLCLPYPCGIYCGLYIEMKYGDNGHTGKQKEFLKDMRAAGHFVVTCYSAEEAVKVIEEYVQLPHGKANDEEERILKDIAKNMDDEKTGQGIESMFMSIPNNSILKNGKVKGGVA